MTHLTRRAVLARLARSIETLREGFGLPRSPAIAEVFDRASVHPSRRGAFPPRSADTNLH